jgi:hypothetical protein
MLSGTCSRRRLIELLRVLPRLYQKTDGDTVSPAAATNCLLPVIKMLVEAGVDVCKRDQKGRSILENARRARRTKTDE